LKITSPGEYIFGLFVGARDLFKGRLFQSFFYSYIPEYSAAKIDTAHLPGDVLDRVEEYKRRNRRFRSLARSCKNLRGIELANCDKQLAVEKAIVSLINKKGIERIAVKYARNAVLFYEWEGLAEGPLDEAKYAEEYLNKYPPRA
jgi:hypothetical protein